MRGVSALQSQGAERQDGQIAGCHYAAAMKEEERIQARRPYGARDTGSAAKECRKNEPANRMERTKMPKGSPELTRARKEEIIAACEKLYETMSFKEITIRDIANATTFGRTSVYNYFQTKEEIVLALLQREYETWTADLEALAASEGPRTREALAEGLARTLEKRALLLKTMTMNHFEMEENSRVERLVEFKVAYGASLRAVEHCLEAFCPEMDAQNRQGFLYAFFPFIYGIYPYTRVSEKQRAAMRGAGVDYVYYSIYEITHNFLKLLLRAIP